MVKKASIKDVASHAGVSIGTVSHVLNGTRHVSEKTSNKVNRAIEELHYSPDATAQTFKTGKRNRVGFIVPDISNTFFATMIEVVEDVLRAEGYNLIIANTKEKPERELDTIRSLTSGVVDGLIIASTVIDGQSLTECIPPGFPVLLVDRRVSGYEGNVVTASSYDATYEAVSRMIEKGHSNIGYVAGMSHLSTTSERLTGFTNAMADKNIQIGEKNIQHADSMFDSANRCMPELMECGCTSVVVSNSIMTTDVLIYLHRLNIENTNKPEIVGFCDSPQDENFFADISFVRQPTAQMARHAGLQIIDRMKHPQKQIREIVLHSSFVEH